MKAAALTSQKTQDWRRKNVNQFKKL